MKFQSNWKDVEGTFIVGEIRIEGTLHIRPWGYEITNKYTGLVQSSGTHGSEKCIKMLTENYNPKDCLISVKELAEIIMRGQEKFGKKSLSNDENKTSSSDDDDLDDFYAQQSAASRSPDGMA